MSRGADDLRELFKAVLANDKYTALQELEDLVVEGGVTFPLR